MKTSENPAEHTAATQPEAMNLLTPVDVARGVYANVALIHHMQEEFVFDFVFQLGDLSVQLVSRVVLSPPHVKLLHSVLGENIARYEKKHGTITAREVPEKPPAPDVAE